MPKLEAIPLPLSCPTFVKMDPAARAASEGATNVYSKMTCDQLKTICTERKLNVKKSTKKPDRIAILVAHDEMTKTMTEDAMKHMLKKRASSDKTTKTSGCVPRLVNVLFGSLLCDAKKSARGTISVNVIKVVLIQCCVATIFP